MRKFKSAEDGKINSELEPFLKKIRNLCRWYGENGPMMTDKEKEEFEKEIFFSPPWKIPLKWRLKTFISLTSHVDDGCVQRCLNGENGDRWAMEACLLHGSLGRRVFNMCIEGLLSYDPPEKGVGAIIFIVGKVENVWKDMLTEEQKSRFVEMLVSLDQGHRGTALKDFLVATEFSNPYIKRADERPFKSPSLPENLTDKLVNVLLDCDGDGSASLELLASADGSSPYARVLLMSAAAGDCAGERMRLISGKMYSRHASVIAEIFHRFSKEAKESIVISPEKAISLAMTGLLEADDYRLAISSLHGKNVLKKELYRLLIERNLPFVRPRFFSLMKTCSDAATLAETDMSLTSGTARLVLELASECLRRHPDRNEALREVKRFLSLCCEDILSNQDKEVQNEFLNLASLIGAMESRYRAEIVTEDMVF